MNLRDHRLRYGDALLCLIRREVAGVHRPKGLVDAFEQAQRRQRIEALCDRFEQLQAALAAAAPACVWEGDYA